MKKQFFVIFLFFVTPFVFVEKFVIFSNNIRYPDYLKSGMTFYYNSSRGFISNFTFNVSLNKFAYIYTFEYKATVLNVKRDGTVYVREWLRINESKKGVVYTESNTSSFKPRLAKAHTFFILPNYLHDSGAIRKMVRKIFRVTPPENSTIVISNVSYFLESYNVIVDALNITLYSRWLKSFKRNQKKWNYIVVTLIVWSENGLLLEVNGSIKLSREDFGESHRKIDKNYSNMQFVEIGGINLVLRESNYLDMLFKNETVYRGVEGYIKKLFNFLIDLLPGFILTTFVAICLIQIARWRFKKYGL